MVNFVKGGPPAREVNAMSALNLKTAVGDWVADRPSRSRILEELGIDYCCGGRRSLDEACAERGLDTEKLLQRLLAEPGEQGSETDWRSATLTALCDHIEQTHHRFLRDELPRLEGLAGKVAAAHGERHPEYLEIASVYAGFQAELDTHMMKEERVLFPAIRALENGDGDAGAFHCGDLSAPMRVMEMEHDAAGEALRRFRELSGDYTPPADACGTLLALLDGLDNLERDLHLHIHKENNLLFPRTRERLGLAPEGAGQAS